MSCPLSLHSSRPTRLYTCDEVGVSVVISAVGSIYNDHNRNMLFEVLVIKYLAEMSTCGVSVLDSVSEDAIATIGFNGDTCDGDLNNPTGHFNYVDKNSGVKMNGDLTAYGVCVSEEEWEGEWFAEDCQAAPLPTPVHLFYVNYRSTNPKTPGEGLTTVYVKDNGEGYNASGSDQMAISVLSGPFSGYEQEGVIQGNIKEHSCTEEN